MEEPLCGYEEMSDGLRVVDERRATIRGGHFEIAGQRVVLVGGNYVLKGPPYFPDVNVVRANARQMVEELAAAEFPGRPQPVVRLATMFEGAMPVRGPVEPIWAAKLEETVAAFAEEGIYVFLDQHQDQMCATNGGEGVPWWVAAHFQDTAGCGCSASCSIPCSVGRCSPSYITTPDRPLKQVLSCVLRRAGVPPVRTWADDPEAPDDVRRDPWKAFSVGSGDPSKMAVGNATMRLNNCDRAHNSGVTMFTEQFQNFMYRWWKCPFDARDRKAVFEPFMVFLRHLCDVWKRHWNVVGVEIMNEPPIGGLPDPWAACRTRVHLFDFYGAVLSELESASIEAPVAIEDVGGTLPGAGSLLNILACWGISGATRRQMERWAARNQLILSVHHYKSLVTQVSFERMVGLAHEVAAAIGPVPVWMSEFHAEGGKVMMAVDLGADAVTFWQWVDTTFTGNRGWHKYPEDVVQAALSEGFSEPGPVDAQGHICWPAWSVYARTVEDGTVWGAWIGGASFGKSSGYLAPPVPLSMGGD